MPYDGIVAAAVVWELSGLLANGRIEKIYQTELDEIILGCHAGGERYRLLLSASPANPRIHLTHSKKENPLAAFPFCMVLRKHIQGGRIVAIRQNGYDRVITLEIEARNEMGDLVTKYLIAEIMGKHSNLILTGPTGVIYDAIKHVDNDISRFREVMPARMYQVPPAQNKKNPDQLDLIGRELAAGTVPEEQSGLSAGKFLLQAVSGFSPYLCQAICDKAGVEANAAIAQLSQLERQRLRDILLQVRQAILSHRYEPFLDGERKDYHCLGIAQRGTGKQYNTVNGMLDEFYTGRDAQDRLQQKKASLTKNIHLALERCGRKLAIQEETLRECAACETYRLQGELLTANLYQLREGMSEAVVEDYTQDPPQPVTIPLDKNLTPAKNAQLLFKKYHKAKSAYDNATIQKNAYLEERRYLENVAALLQNCTGDLEIQEIRQELSEEGYLKFGGTTSAKHSKRKKGKTSGNAPVSPPMKFQSADGYEILVGKNNKQNDQLTLRTASAGDLWFHVKNAPGSHVILRTVSQGGTPTDLAIQEAAVLAATYSSAKRSAKVAVDYTKVKHVKKASGAKPGMVYYTDYRTILVQPREL